MDSTFRALRRLEAILIMSLAACGSPQRSEVSAAPAPRPAPASSAQATGREGMCPMCPMCPMMGSGAAIKASAGDTSVGVALVFTTTADVGDLRARVRRMAAMHNQMAGKPGASHGGMMHRQMVPSTASVEDVPGGARIVFVPTDPTQLTALRQQVHSRAELMQQGKCPMMTEHEQHHPSGA